MGTLGGGMKHPYLWVDYKRVLPEGAPPLVEKVRVSVVWRRTKILKLFGLNLEYCHVL